ncbi:hypothetical protein V2J09_015428 [Rumex salicifolius]
MDDDVEGSVGVYSAKKQRLEFDFDKLIDDSNDDPLPEIVIAKTTGAGDHPRLIEQSQLTGTKSGGLERLSDKELEDKIRRLESEVSRFGSKLHDKGVKLKANLRAHEEERERRKHLIAPKAPIDCKTTDHTESLRPSRVSPEVRVGDRSGSRFANLFAQKLETDKNSHTRIYDAFDDEPQPLGHGDRRNRKQKARPSDKERDKKGSLWKGRENLSLSSSEKINKNDLPQDYGRYQLKNASQGRHLDKSNVDKTVVLLDEEEPKFEEEKLYLEDAAMRDMKIFYPLSNDPECVEIQYKDLKCLRPREYLTSPIMNFYIRFLQGKSFAVDDAPHDYHFFNTYFYKKLQEAVSLQNGDKEASFNKLRRWWRGVNLFQKTYIFLPVHDDLHWSLAIICIPDKEDESGPIILHLDSLGFHSSESVFGNIKTFLKEEWNIVKDETGPPHVPFSDQTWKNLPSEIQKEIITVPRQNNDSDCGLFVLYFMERFIKDAPQRLRMRDLGMFGRCWFKPEEASGLRKKIRVTLLDEFSKSRGILDNVILLPYHSLTAESGSSV